jgi:hypothetical protein
MGEKVKDWRREGSVSLFIDAPAEEIYRCISDVVTTGERSKECRRVEWMPSGPRQPVVGARFRGHNRFGLARWSRACEIIAAEPGRAFAFRTVPERFDPSRMDSTEWSYELVREKSATRVTHSYRIARLPLPPFKRLYGFLMPHHKDMRPAMQHTLQMLKHSLEVESK